MLVFVRKTDDGIVIPYGDDEIVVTVVSIKGDKVRLGIDAPIEVPVHRGEVHELLSQDWQGDRSDIARASCNLRLPKHQLRWLDRIAEQLDLDGRPASRQLLIETILDAMASIDFDWTAPSSIADLKDRLGASLRAANRP